MGRTGIVCACLVVLVDRGIDCVAVAQQTPAVKTWTDNTGRYSVTAEFVDVRDGQVRLKKQDGSLISLPLERLSDGDREYVERLLALRAKQFDGPRRTVPCKLEYLTISPDGTTLASVGKSATEAFEMEVKLWSATTGRQIATVKDFAGWGGGSLNVYFTSDGKRIVGDARWPEDSMRGVSTAGLGLWDVRTGKKQPRPAGITRRGNSAAVGFQRPRIFVFDAATGQVRVVHADPINPFSPPENGLAVSLDHKRYARRARDGTVVFGEVSDNLPRTLRGSTSGIVSFSQDEAVLIVACPSKTIEIWDAKTEQRRLTIDAHTGEIVNVCISPDGQTLASIARIDARLHEAKLWDVPTGKELGPIAKDLPSVQCLAFSVDSRLVAVGGDHGSEPLRLLNARTGEQLASLRGHTFGVYAVFFLPDGKTIVSGGRDRAIRWWDVPAVPQRGGIQGRGPSPTS